MRLAAFKWRRLGWLPVVVLLAGAAAWALSDYSRRQLSAANADLYESIPTSDRGTWEYALEDPQAIQRQERASELSLPYSSGSAPVPDATGVRHYDPGAAQDGVNLYVAGHRAEALLIDMEGRVLHRWRMPYERAFPGRSRTGQTGNWRRAWLLPDGSLLAIFQAAGLIKMDRDSELLWAHPWVFYNHVTIDSRGHVHSLTKELRAVEGIHGGEPVLEDFAVELDLEGRLLRKVSLLEALRRSPWAAVLEDVVSHADVLHSNTVFRLEDPPEGLPPGFEEGNLLVSLRELDLVGVVDPEREVFVWALRGSWHRQHQPQLTPEGELLLFDNLGRRRAGAPGRDAARVLRVDPWTGAERWQFPAADQPLLRSEEAGSCQQLANGNLLITETERGRALEIDPEGRIVWEFVNPHRSGPFIAALFEVVRLPRPRWLEAEASGG